ncbi:tubulin-folding cofactor B-like [Sipha flava]|jgi:tubulin-folding cofactor B|uniref:Tubulin-folding cofactor B-like n=1 Tax=Sipha flava TaxID=143950 RepID=A0A8B8GML3_9HEMI|nr:tubulin-folding cofactor B-like [Sipha flava]
MSFLKKNQLGKFNPDYQKQRKIEREQQEIMEKEQIEKIEVGQRCCIRLSNKPVRTGTVMYKGRLNGKHGYWVGVKYDKPYGRHDGCLDGKRYFETSHKHGSFITPSAIEIGDLSAIDDEL